jgi:SAM-dependent methyltransferase
MTGATQSSTADHWNAVYETKPIDGVSWYRPHLDRSLAIIDSLALAPNAPILDVGAGASTLAEDLLDRGYHDITLLDISERALARARERVGERAALMRWLVADIRHAPLERASVRLWHDRAVLHFLANAEDRAAYATLAQTAVMPGGHALISGFAPDGPARCSNIEVVRATPEAIAATLGPGFQLERSDYELHRTPWGSEQAFCYALCRRVDD